MDNRRKKKVYSKLSLAESLQFVLLLLDGELAIARQEESSVILKDLCDAQKHLQRLHAYAKQYEAARQQGA